MRASSASSHTRSRLASGVGVDAAVEQPRGDEVLRILQRAPHGQQAGRGAVVVLRRPVVLRPRAERAADRRQRDRLGRSTSVFGCSPPLQRRQIGERLDRRARLALRLRGAIELAQRIGEPARHREDAAGLVLQHQRRALHGRRARAARHGQRFCPCPRPRSHRRRRRRSGRAGLRVPGRERHDAAIGQTDADHLAGFPIAGALRTIARVQCTS